LPAYGAAGRRRPAVRPAAKSRSVRLVHPPTHGRGCRGRHSPPCACRMQAHVPNPTIADGAGPRIVHASLSPDPECLPAPGAGPSQTHTPVHFRRDMAPTINHSPLQPTATFKAVSHGVKEKIHEAVMKIHHNCLTPRVFRRSRLESGGLCLAGRGLHPAGWNHIFLSRDSGARGGGRQWPQATCHMPDDPLTAG